MTKQDDPKPTPLEARVTELEAELLETKEGQVRALADLENFRRRQSESQAGWTNHAVTSFIKKILPNFLELSLGAAHTQDEVAKSTIDKFFRDLEKHGFSKIEPTPGTLVDADQHEVLMAADGAPGTIVDCLELGWQYNGQVVTPAKVSAAPQ